MPNAAARQLAEWILCQHKTKSYRAIADGFPRREDGSQTVKAGTLNAIAKSGGAYVPKEHEIRQALGLVKQGKQWLPGEYKTARRISRMAEETKKALEIEKGR